MTKQRILFVSRMMSDGGAQRVTSSVLKYLDRSKYSASLFLIGEETTYTLPADVEVFTCPYASILDFRRCLWSLAKCIDSQQFDVLVSNVEATSAFCGLALRLTKYRPRWVARVANNLEKGPLLIRYAAPALIGSADCVILNSAALKDDFVAKHPSFRQRCMHVPNVLDVPQLKTLQPKRDPVKIITLARLVPQKRIDRLIEAFSALTKRYSGDVQLVIYGRGPEEQKLRTLVQARGLATQVQINGFVAEPFRALVEADIFALTSDYEGSPNALMEAQALGLPAVATNCDYGPSEIVIEGKSGYLVNTNDHAMLVERLLTLVQQPDLRATMGAVAMQHARKLFSPESVMPAWERALSAK